VTEQEWLECTDPRAMLEFLRCKGSKRKLRLFPPGYVRATYREAPHDMPDGIRQVLELVERYADDLASPVDLLSLRGSFLGQCRSNAHEFARMSWEHASSQETVHRGIAANVLRDIFGPLPFRATQLDPARLTPDVLALAQAAYEERLLPTGELVVRQSSNDRLSAIRLH
jgi:hypothetical protein